LVVSGSFVFRLSVLLALLDIVGYFLWAAIYCFSYRGGVAHATLRSKSQVDLPNKPKRAHINMSSVWIIMLWASRFAVFSVISCANLAQFSKEAERNEDWGQVVFIWGCGFVSGSHWVRQHDKGD
jgi:hypothetical protein